MRNPHLKTFTCSLALLDLSVGLGYAKLFLATSGSWPHKKSYVIYYYTDLAGYHGFDQYVHAAAQE